MCPRRLTFYQMKKSLCQASFDVASFDGVAKRDPRLEHLWQKFENACCQAEKPSGWQATRTVAVEGGSGNSSAKPRQMPSWYRSRIKLQQAPIQPIEHPLRFRTLRISGLR